MKSLICSLGLILMGFICQAQTFPTTSNFGGATTLMKNPNYGGTQGGLIPYTFSDTIAANAALTYLKNYDGSLIKTTSPNAIWWRDLALHKWVMILPAGSPVVNDAWTLNGNVVGSLGAQPLLGTQDFYDLNLITNSTIQASIPANGINRVSASKYKYLVIDTTASQGHQLGFMDGGSGSSGWSLTGNSGTTAGTNFLGTTDSVGLMFKANNIQSGYINLQKTSTSLGYYSLNSNTIGTGNEAFGARSLMANTVGNGNQAFGTNTLTANTSGSGNVAVGSDVLSANTIGQNNTGVGNAASLTNIVGNENSAFGLNSLLISSGSNNVAIGAYAGQSNGTFSNRLYVNSLYRADLLSDTTKSIIYGAQDATASNQRLYANSQFFLPYAASQYNAADSMMVILPSTGKVGYRVIPSGNPGTVTSVATGYGLSGGTITTTGTLIADTSILVNKTGSQTLTNKTINGANNSLTIRLANDVTGVLPVANGGTNASTASITSFNNITGYTASGATGTTSTNLVFSASPTFTGTVTGATSTWSGTHTITTNGALSAPAITGTGTWITGGSATTTKPYLLIEPTGTTSTGWNTNGTGLGINAASGFTGNLIDAQLLGVSKFKVDYNGETTLKSNLIFGTAGSSIYDEYGFRAFSFYYNNTQIRNNLSFSGGNVSSLMPFGGLTSSYPAIDRNGTGIDIKLADNSAYTGLTALTLTGNTNITSPLIIGGTGTTSSLTYKTTTGVGTTGADHIFQVGNNGATEAMRILNNGNIGVGNPIPSYPLDVKENSSDEGMVVTRKSGVNAFRVQANNLTMSNSTGGGTVQMAGSASGGMLLSSGQNFSWDANATLSGAADVNLSRGAANKLYVGTGAVGNYGGTLIAGNVGIGTTTPAYKLDVSGTANITGTTYIGNTTLQGGNEIHFETSSNTDNVAGYINYYGYNNSTTRYRDLQVSDGRAGLIAYFKGSTGNVGIGTTSPNSTLHTNGSFATAYVAKTANYTLTSSDYLVEVTSGTVTETLPTAVGIIGRIYVITNSGSGVVTLGTTSSQTFANVVATPTTLTLNQFATVTVISNGTNWLRITSL